jgi:hypothetical protein
MPVGAEELDLIGASKFTAFSPGVAELLVLYTVCSLRRTEEMASKLNPQSGRGYVTRFEVASSFMAQHDRHAAGGKEDVEYRILAESLQALNQNIVGKIHVMRSFPEGPGT